MTSFWLVIIFLFLQGESQSSNIFTTERVLFAIALIGSILTNVVQYKNSKSEIIHKTDTRTIGSQEKLIQARDTEIKGCEDELEKSKQAKDYIETEYKALAGIVIHELLDFAGLRKSLELRNIEVSVLTEEVKNITRENIRLRRDQESK